MLQKNPDFRFKRMRKSGKTEFIEVNIERAIERAVSTHLNSVVRHIPHFFIYMHACRPSTLLIRACKVCYWSSILNCPYDQYPKKMTPGSVRDSSWNPTQLRNKVHWRVNFHSKVDLVVIQINMSRLEKVHHF